MHTDDEAHDEFSENSIDISVDDDEEEDFEYEQKKPFAERVRSHLLEMVEHNPEAVEVKLKRERSHYGTMQNYIEGNTDYGAGHDDAHAGRIYQEGIKNASKHLQEQVSTFFHDAEEHAESWARDSIIAIGNGGRRGSQDAHERMHEIELYSKFQRETFDNME